MLSPRSLETLRTQLEQASCPVFLFDNDADGLCSFLIARRALGKGIGIPVRSYPELDVGYCEQAVARGADLLVVLDKPFLSERGVVFARERSLPVIVIDHHVVTKPNWEKEYELYTEYNPALLSGKAKSTEPVSFLMYATLGRKEDLWLMLAGCIADHYLPKKWKQYTKQFPALGGKANDPFTAYYTTELGVLAQAFNFGLKDSLSHVKELLTFLIEVSRPEDVLGEGAPVSFLEKVNTLRTELERLLGEGEIRGNAVILQYGGATSMSADVANKLSFVYPGKYVLVAYRKGGLTNLSLRGKNVKQVFEQLLPSFTGMMGGGHDDAVGGRISSFDVERFINAFQEAVA